MSKVKKVVKAEDGTLEAVEGEFVETTEYPLAGPKKVKWTKKAEDDGVFSEHGPHRAGDIVETAYADLLIERGHAEEATD